MSTAVPVIAIIVVWLFVLAPWILGRNNRPMSHTGEAFEDTRVLFEGDSGKVAGRRRPRLRADDVHRREDQDEADYEVVEAADTGVDESDAEATKPSSRSVTIAGAARRAKSQPSVPAAVRFLRRLPPQLVRTLSQKQILSTANWSRKRL